MKYEGLSHQDHYGESSFQPPKGEFSSGNGVDTYDSDEMTPPTHEEQDVQRRFDAGEISSEDATRELDILAQRAHL